MLGPLELSERATLRGRSRTRERGTLCSVACVQGSGFHLMSQVWKLQGTVSVPPLGDPGDVLDLNGGLPGDPEGCQVARGRSQGEGGASEDEEGKRGQPR